LNHGIYFKLFAKGAGSTLQSSAVCVLAGFYWQNRPIALMFIAEIAMNLIAINVVAKGGF
jgi:hypothetical protein